MKIKFKVWVSTNKIQSETRDELEIDVDDDATQEEIEDAKKEIATEWMWENIDFGWS